MLAATLITRRTVVESPPRMNEPKGSPTSTPQRSSQPNELEVEEIPLVPYRGGTAAIMLSPQFDYMLFGIAAKQRKFGSDADIGQNLSDGNRSVASPNATEKGDHPLQRGKSFPGGPPAEPNNLLRDSMAEIWRALSKNSQSLTRKR